MSRKITILLFALLPLISFAAAPWADNFMAERGWMYIAYKYCLIYGIIFFFILGGISLTFKNKINDLFTRFSGFLRQHWFFGLICCGLLLSIPVGFIASTFYFFFWFFAIVPLGLLSLIFIIILSIGKFRKKYLLGPNFLKWLIIFCFSAIFAVFCFIGTAYFNVFGELSNYFAYYWNHTLVIQRHPFDSLMYLLPYPLWFSICVIASIVWVTLGILFRKLITFVTEKKDA